MNIDAAYKRLGEYGSSHELFDGYYEGTKRIPTLGISIPPVLNKIETVVGWPGTCVDVLEERLDFLGWDDDGKYGLEQVYQENDFGYESSLSNIDCLLYGCSFFSVSTGFEDGVPGAIITAESAKHTTGAWNNRKRRLDWAMTRYQDEEGKYTKAALFEENKNTYYVRKDENSPWVVLKTDNHKLGRCTVIRQINRGRAGRREGKSEITRAVRSYTDTAVRTLLGMETNREFYSSPQRYVLGAKEKAFTDASGNPIPGWRAVMGALWNLERDEEWAAENPGSDGLPQVGQFSANPPGPYLEQVRGLSMLLASEVGFPASYLGFTSDNPPSADSIRALEGRLVKRAERRQSAWDSAYKEVAVVCAKVQGKAVPKLGDIQTLWRDPATPTKAADADRATKLAGAGIIPATSRTAREMAGLSPKEIKRLEKEETKAEFKRVITEGMKPGVPADQAPQPNDAANGKAPVGQPG